MMAQRSMTIVVNITVQVQDLEFKHAFMDRNIVGAKNEPSHGKRFLELRILLEWGPLKTWR